MTPLIFFATVLTILKGLGFSLIGLLGLFVIGTLLFLWINSPERRRQPCPSCGRKARYVSSCRVEGGGRRSFTDGLQATYRCNCGHEFRKTWTIG